MGRDPGLAYRVKCRYILTFWGKWTSVVGQEWMKAVGGWAGGRWAGR